MSSLGAHRRFQACLTGSVSALDVIGVPIEAGRTTDRPDPLFRLTSCRRAIHDWRRMACQECPWLMDVVARDISEFRAPPPDEHTIGVMVPPLLDRVVDADRVDRGAS